MKPIRKTQITPLCHVLTVGLLAVLAVPARGQVIPADRRIEWSGNVGVPGGIPTYPVYTNLTSINNTGAASVSDAIQYALDNCPAYMAVVLPAGTFKLTSPVYLTHTNVLRGAGPKATFLSMEFATSSSAPGLGIGKPKGGDTVWSLTSSAVKGSTNLTVTSSSGLAAGRIIAIEQANDGTTLVSNGSTEGGALAQDLWYGTTRILTQLLEVKSVSGNAITVWPPLNWTWTNALGAQLHQKGNGAYAEGNGIEDLCVIQTNSSGEKNFEISFAKNSWLKGVESRNCYKFHCQLVAAFRCEVRDSYFFGAQGATSGGNYGISLALASSFNLVENNIVNDCISSLILAEMAQGNVFGYNYVPHVQYYPTNWLQADLTSHDGHPMMNLYEGNVGHMMVGDYIHGSSSHNTLFRNRLTGSQIGTDKQNRGVKLDMWNRYYNIVGNVLGSTNVATVYEAVGPGSSPMGSAVIYELGYGVYSSGSTAFADANVPATTLRAGNYVIYTGFSGVPTSESLGVNTLPASLYLSGRPAWWGAAPWPPIGPDVNPTVNRIPAQDRFLGTGNLPPNPPANLRIIGASN